jgi:hypothetical protein
VKDLAAIDESAASFGIGRDMGGRCRVVAHYHRIQVGQSLFAIAPGRGRQIHASQNRRDYL